MQSPDEAPKLPKLPFLLGDAVLLAAALFIGITSDSPLTTAPLVAMVVCVALGAVLAAVPFLVDYARRQEAALTERQNSLEALVRTTSAAAEQISIATAGFHQVAELAQKNLKAAEHLPHKLQEKINEFNQQLNESAVVENETLQQEIATLRASEAEKLESAADKIHKLSAEFARLDTATQESLAAAAETLAKLPSLAEQARELFSAQVAAVVPRAAESIEASISRSREAAMAAIEQKLSAASTDAVARTLAEIESRLELAAGQLAARAETAASSLTTAVAAATVAVQSAATLASRASAHDSSPGVSETAPKPEPKRKRSSPPPPPPSSETTSGSVTAAAPDSTEPPAPDSPPSAAALETAVAEGADASPAQMAPAAPEPLVASVEPQVAPSAPPDAAPAAVPEPHAEPAESVELVRKRARKPSEENAPMLFPGLLNDGAPIGEKLESADEFSQSAPDETSVKSALSADGLTRLIATAYIGIGNKLFIRGEGAGLSWDKGVPLQFVSIGKWRWETAEAAAPVTAKLYKNDQIECTALGTLTFEPGHQTEVTANFQS